MTDVLVTQEVLGYLNRHGVSTVLEISCELDISPTGAEQALRELESQQQVAQGPLPPWKRWPWSGMEEAE